MACKTVLRFLNEILHVSALKVKANDIARLQAHVCDNKGELKMKFSRRALHLNDHATLTVPRFRFVLEFAVVDLPLMQLIGIQQWIRHRLCSELQAGIGFQTNRVCMPLRLGELKQPWNSKAAVTAKDK